MADYNPPRIIPPLTIYDYEDWYSQILEDGVQGAQGAQGIAGGGGGEGVQGAQGNQGFQGNQGLQGVQGVNGVNGVQGTQGVQGFDGLQGVQGFDGLQGNQGNQGFDGSQGNQGVQGSLSVGTEVNTTTIADFAGTVNQGVNSVAIGYESGKLFQGLKSVAIGYQAGHTAQGDYSIAIGNFAGGTAQGDTSVAIGFQAGTVNQQVNSVCIGNRAGRRTLGNASIAIGVNAGEVNLGQNAIAIGNGAGQTNLTTNNIAIGAGSFSTSTGLGIAGLAIGNSAQSRTGGIALGANSGNANVTQCVAIGIRTLFGNSTATSTSSIAIGSNVGWFGRMTESVCIGHAALGSQSTTPILNRTVLMGTLCANGALTGTLEDSVGIGDRVYNYSGAFTGNRCVHIGSLAGNNKPLRHSCAFGYESGCNFQGIQGVALGYQSGFTGQGTAAVAIGAFAGQNTQASNSIILNATGTNLNSGTTGFFVKPIQNGTTGDYLLSYDNPTGEIKYIPTPINYNILYTETYGATTTFDIDTNGPLQTVVLTANSTIAVTISNNRPFVLLIEQGGSGSYTVTWFSTIKWSGGVVPTLTTTVGKIDAFGFIRTSAGNYLGYIVGLNA